MKTQRDGTLRSPGPGCQGQSTLGGYDNRAGYAAKNAADFETASLFVSAHRDDEEDIPHTAQSAQMVVIRAMNI
jgi:hypothetical protein